MKIDVSGREIVQFQNHRVIVNLFKDFLCILEDTDSDTQIMLDNLKSAHPELINELNIANHFTDDKWEQLRSRVLGKGNDAIRELNNNLEFFDIKIRTKD